MTVPTEKNRNDYVGNDVADTFAYNFRIFLKTDLLVTTADLNGVETTLTVDVDYTVAGVQDVGGGSITLTPDPLATGFLLAIRLVLPLTQNTDIRNQGAYLPEVVEDTFDRVVKMIQGMKDEVNRSLKLPETVDPDIVNAILPAPQALQFFRWNAAADAIENAIIGSSVGIILPGANGIAVFTTPNTFSIRTITGSATITIADGDGQSGNPTISVTALGITPAELAALAVETAKIANDAVDATKLRDDASVDANRAVTTDHIRDLAIATAKLAALAVTTAKIDALAVTPAKLAALAVETAKIANDAVTVAKMEPNAKYERLFVDTSTHSFTDNSENVIFTGTVPGGTLGTDGLLRLLLPIMDVQLGSGAASTIFRVKYGGVLMHTTTVTTTDAAPLRKLRYESWIAATGGTSSQAAGGSHFSKDAKFPDDTSHDYTTGLAVDSTVNQTLKVTMELPTGSNPQGRSFYGLCEAVR